MPFETLTGIVQSIDRSTNTCLVQLGLDTVGGFLIQRPTVPATYRSFPPPPLSYVDIRQKETGVWRVEGSVSDRFGILHEDFMATETGAFIGDTNWRSITNGPAGTIGQSQLARGFGCIFIQTPAQANTALAISKANDCLSLDSPLWFSAKVQLGSLTSTSQVAGLFGSDVEIQQGSAANHQATWYYDTGASTTDSRFNCATGGANTVITVPFLPAVNTFFTIDLVVAESAFAALWIDGDGPYVITTNVPAIANGNLNPALSVWTYVAIVKALRSDWVYVEAFTPVAHPLRDLILPESAAIG